MALRLGFHIWTVTTGKIGDAACSQLSNQPINLVFVACEPIPCGIGIRGGG